MSLTNNQQAILMMGSGALIAIGSVSLPLGVSPYISVAVAAAGVVGLGIKEYLGTSYSDMPELAQGIEGLTSILEKLFNNAFSGNTSKPAAGSQQPVPTPSAKDIPTPTGSATFSLDSNVKSPSMGSSFIISVANGPKNGTFTLIEDDNNQPLTSPHTLDANGNGYIQVSNLDTTSPLGFLLNANGSVTYHAVAGNLATNSITQTKG